MSNPESEQEKTVGEVLPPSIENIFGMRRSGNHIVIKWLESCYKSAGMSTIHENDVYSGHLPPELQGSDPDLTAEDIRERAHDSDILIISYEDMEFGSRQDAPVYSELKNSEVGRASRDTIVIRDWFNMTASRLTYQTKHNELAPKGSLGRIFGLSWEEVEECWVEHARIALEMGSKPEVIIANYNQWVAEPDYREELAGKYNLLNSDDSIDIVPSNGAGSSFDRRNLDGNGSTMNVLRRWEDLDPVLVERYKSLISSPVLADINLKLFGIDQEEVVHSLG